MTAEVAEVPEIQHSRRDVTGDRLRPPTFAIGLAVGTGLS